MLNHTFTGPFRKDRKLMEKRNKVIKKLDEVLYMLINEQPLLSKQKNHPLHGEWEGSFECHIEPDWLLIYDTDPVARKITFHRTGSHSDLY